MTDTRWHDRLLWALLIAVCAGVALYALLYRPSSQTVTEPSLSRASIVADFELTDQTGQTVTRADLHGKVWIAAFIFTRCTMSCGKITEAMADLQKKLNHPDIRLVSISVDPKHDTREVLKKYAENPLVQADSQRWLLLTDKNGDKQKVYDLIERSFQNRPAENPSADPGMAITHSNRLMLVDRQGNVVGSYLSVLPAGKDESFEINRPEMDRLLHDAEKLAAETAQ